MTPERPRTRRPQSRWSSVVLLAALPWLPFSAVLYDVMKHGNQDDGASRAFGVLFLLLSFFVLVASHVLAGLGRITIRQFLVLNSAPMLCVGFIVYVLCTRTG